MASWASWENLQEILSQSTPPFFIRLSTTFGHSSLYKSQRDYAKAEPLYKQALEIRRQVLGEKHPDFAMSLNNFAVFYRSQSDFATAEPLALQATRVMRSQLEGTALVQSERQQLAYGEKTDLFYRNYVDIAGNRAGDAEAAYQVVLSWKGVVTVRQRLTRIARTNLDKDLEAKELFQQLDSVSRQISVWSAKSADTLPKGVDLAKKLAELTEAREAIEAKLSARTEAFRRLKASRELTASGLQRLLPEGTVLVDFVQYYGNLAAFIVTKDKIARVELGPTKPLQEATDQFRLAMKRTRPGKDDPGQMLRNKLLDPLEKYIQDAKLLLIAPDGPLHSLPFAALPGKMPGTYLLEQVAIAVIPVPQMLPELLAKRSPSESAPSLLALGDVDFDVNPITAQKDNEGWKRRRAGNPQDWARLPGTRGEVLAIEDTFRKSVPQGKLTVLRDGQPTEAAVRKLASGHEYLHFATHGFFAGQDVKSALSSPPLTKGGPGGLETESTRRVVIGHHPGLLSGIVLAGANKPKDDDDGVLTALEVSELDLTKVELAVLSACETGLGEVAGGEGVLGLQRAFQIAGARSTVTSLWKVDDDATRKLMERFYDNYWKKNMGTLEALREAQLWMLREGALRGIVRLDEPSDSPRRTPPYYWAAFVLSGDWR